MRCLGWGERESERESERELKPQQLLLMVEFQAWVGSYFLCGQTFVYFGKSIMSVTRQLALDGGVTRVPGCVGRPAESSVVLHFTVCAQILDAQDLRASLQVETSPVPQQPSSPPLAFLHRVSIDLGVRSPFLCRLTSVSPWLYWPEAFGCSSMEYLFLPP